MSTSPLVRRHLPAVPVRLADGGLARLRLLQPGERTPVLQVFAGMSAESRASRYLVAMPRLSETFLRVLTATDGATRAAWLVTVDDRPAGIGRYAAMPDDPAAVDIALEVVDEQQRRGLGAVLLDAVTSLAAAHGVRRLHAAVLPHNIASRRLLERVGVPLRFEDGLLEGTGPLRLLDPPRVDRRAVLQIAGPVGTVVRTGTDG